MSIPFDHNSRNRPVSEHCSAPNYDDVVQAHHELGTLVAQRDMLLRALADDRLHRVHRSILKSIVVAMGDGVEGCPSLSWLSSATGYGSQVIKNHVGELVRWGFLQTARRAPDGGGRAVAHYTPALQSLEELRAEIRRHIEQLERRPVQRTWGAEVTPGYDLSISKVTSPGLPQTEAKVTSPGLPQDLRSPQEVTSGSSTYIKNARARLSTRNNSKEEEETGPCKRQTTVGKNLVRDGVTLPAALQDIIAKGNAPRSAATLLEEIEAALDRGLDRTLIEEQLRAAIVWADKDGEVSPSKVLHRCTQFVQTADTRPKRAPAYTPPDPLAHNPRAGSGFIPSGDEDLPPEMRTLTVEGIMFRHPLPGLHDAAPNMARSAFAAAVKAAKQRGVYASEIEADVLRAVAASAATKQDAEPSPSAVLRLCVTYLTRSKNPATTWRSDPLAPNPRSGSGFSPIPDEDLPPQFRARAN